MYKQVSSIRACLLPLLEGGAIGLDLVIICANVIAVDARYNLWFGLNKENGETEDEMLESLDIYDRVIEKCVNSVKIFEELDDAEALKKSLREIARELQAAIPNQGT